MKRKWYWLSCVVLILLLGSMLFMFGCGTSTTSKSTAPVSSAPSSSAAPAAPASSSAAPAPAAPKILKVGVVAWMGWPLGVDMVHGIEIQADLINKAGGLNVGGEKYQIQPIVYDSNANQTTAVAAANRLIFQDKVGFIVGDPLFNDGWLPITEQNKVVVCAGSPAPTILDPKLKYSFQTGFMNSQVLQMSAWWAKKFPDKNNVAVAFPDTQDGHNYQAVYEKAHAAFDIKVTSMFYPANSQDLSSLGTKVVSLNPDAFEATAGGATDAFAFRAVYQAGYKGQMYMNGTAPSLALAAQIGPEALEGFINGAWAIEFDPALTDTSKEYKAAYIAKYGKWDGPEVMFTSGWACIKAAIQKANSLDPDKVSDIIANGLRFESPTGTAQMVSRPDMGNNRTIDSVNTYYIKKTTKGQPVLIDTIKIDDAVAVFQGVYK
jgi:branched-chain amino acid transport system substrate-binding protein